MLKSLARVFSIVAAVALAVPMIQTPAFAAKAKTTKAAAKQGNKPLGAYKDWNAYMLDDPSKKVCFVVSEPKSKKLSKGARRDAPFFLVTRWAPGQGLQPSTIVGYPQAPGTKAKVTVGSDKFEMFVDGDGAWMESEDGDRRLVEAMRKGSTMTVEAVSARGTKSIDRYSLAGISSALQKIDDTCK